MDASACSAYLSGDFDHRECLKGTRCGGTCSIEAGQPTRLRSLRTRQRQEFGEVRRVLSFRRFARSSHKWVVGPDRRLDLCELLGNQRANKSAVTLRPFFEDFP